jgi:Family of unknown function (DUF6206)
VALVSTSEIEAFEQRLEAALRTGHAQDLDLIGYGEVTIAVKLATPHGSFACKRLVPFSSHEAVERAAGLIASYVEQLEACGIDVVETETPILERPEGHVLYCVQPMLTPGTLGPAFLRDKTASEAAPFVRRIFERIRASVTPSLAPDGQLTKTAATCSISRNRRGRSQHRFASSSIDFCCGGSWITITRPGGKRWTF